MRSPSRPPTTYSRLSRAATANCSREDDEEEQEDEEAVGTDVLLSAAATGATGDQLSVRGSYDSTSNAAAAADPSKHENKLTIRPTVILGEKRRVQMTLIGSRNRKGPRIHASTELLSGL